MYVGWGHRRNDPCQVSSQSVQQFRLPRRSKFTISHRLGEWLLQQCYALTCYTVTSTDVLNVGSGLYEVCSQCSPSNVTRDLRHLLLVSGQDAALWLLPLPPSLPPLTDDDRLLQCIGSITSGISDCLQLAVVRNRAATFKKN